MSYFQTWFQEFPGKDEKGFIVVPLPESPQRPASTRPTLNEGQVIYSQGKAYETVKDGRLVIGRV